jgi:hypothetical protein
VILDGLDDVSAAPQLAGSSPTHLQVVLAHTSPVEHRVE